MVLESVLFRFEEPVCAPLRPWFILRSEKAQFRCEAAEAVFRGEYEWVFYNVEIEPSHQGLYHSKEEFINYINNLEFLTAILFFAIPNQNEINTKAIIYFDKEKVRAIANIQDSMRAGQY